MRFQVPQFIDIKDKIIGPFTFQQFLYLAGGAGGSYAIYRLLPGFIAIILIIPILGIALALTFYKVNDRPFIHALQSSMSFFFKPKLYIWKQRLNEKKEEPKKIEKKKEELENIPRLTESKLSDISWSLEVIDMKKEDE